MRAFARTTLIAASLLAAGAAEAEDDQPVIVELFTSQGCSSCPPADALLAKLAEKPGVLPLALHVDYWDYIGWPDDFAEPAFTERQKAYARAAGERTIYTPQMIVGGADRVIGSRAMEVADLVQAHSVAANPVDIEVTRSGGSVRIVARPDGPLGGPLLVQLVTFEPHKRVAIEAGENAGSVIDYANVVQDWKIVGEWDGAGTWERELEAEGPAAIIVQMEGPGPILGAARID